MKVSIIVPVYNVEEYLPRCIESILTQTFTDFECILVDDASTDNCPALCDEYTKRDIRISVIHKKQNEGLPQARKTGFENSSAPYVLNIDSDDWIEPDMIETLYTKAISGDFDIVCCDFWRDTVGANTYFKQKSLENDIMVLMKQVLSWGEFLPVLWNKLVKHEVYAQVVYPKINFSEDRVIMTQVLYYAKNIAYINEPFYHWCERYDSLCSNRNNLLNSVIEDYNSYITILLFISDKMCDCMDEYVEAIYEHIIGLSIRCSENKKILALYKRSFSKVVDVLKVHNADALQYIDEEMNSIRKSFIALNKKWRNFYKARRFIINLVVFVYKAIVPSKLRMKIKNRRGRNEFQNDYKKGY